MKAYLGQTLQRECHDTGLFCGAPMNFLVADLPKRVSPDVSLTPVERVAQTTGELCAKHFGASLRAVVLVGSLARDEGSIVENDGLLNFVSDAEFILILRDSLPIPRAADVANLTRMIEAQLALQSIRCHIALGYSHCQYLREMLPHIFAYEMKATGRVVFGETDVISLIPKFVPSDIPMEDAWRLLSNRMIETAEVLAEISGHAVGPVPPLVVYRVIKLYLDMATSLLLFLGEYAPSYRQRSENLAALSASDEGLEMVPFPLGPFSKMVNVCTGVKLSPTALPEAFANWNWVADACQFASDLWIWELGRITGAREGTSPTELCLRAIRQQPLAARLRGWFYALRHRGWHRSARQWPRWISLARTASPRYWLYAATGEVFLRPEMLLMGHSDKFAAPSDCHMLSNYLPLIPPSSSPAVRDRQTLLRAIAWNYHEFLEGTRG
jgi:hypothetical protein